MRFTLCFALACTLAAKLALPAQGQPANFQRTELLADGKGLAGAADEFEFVSTNQAGDFDVRIRVESLSLVDAWSEAGLVVRESGAANARFAAALCTPSISGCLFKSRSVAGQSVSQSGSFPVNYPQTWLRLRRVANTFTAYAGLDGRAWALLGTVEIPMRQTVLLGFGAASHSVGTTRAIFNDFGPVGAIAQETELASLEPLQQSSRLTSLIISKIMYHPSPRSDGRKLEFIELLNTLGTPQDLSGYRLTGDADFVFPAGTVLAGGAFLVVARDPGDMEAVYGLSGVLGPFNKGKGLPNDGGVIRLRNRQNAILLEVPYEAKFPWPSGADGTGSSLVLVRPSFGEADPKAWAASDTFGGTPGAVNTRVAAARAESDPDPIPANVVFNEIMYHPISGDDGDQYIELHNSGLTAANLTGWQIEGGVEFSFAPGTILNPSGYLVVARNGARLLTNYPGLNTTNTVGDFSGKLSHGGERLALTRPGVGAERILVDEISYREGGNWGQWSDGGGSSLEKIDPHADGRYPSNWADSDESGKAPWTTISTTGRLDNGNVTADELQVLLQGAGECLIDDVQVMTAAGANLIANSTFENGTVGWTVEGTEASSVWNTQEGYNSGRSFVLSAVARGDNQVNRVRIPLTTALAPNSTATIQAQVRWLKGSPDILFRLRGNWLEAAGRMDLPRNLGTPGAPNSRRVLNAGPAIRDVHHSPILPQAGEPVTVSARISDPDGMGRVILHYRIDPAGSSTAIPMIQDADGCFRAQIPGQTAGTLVAFTLGAEDAHNALSSYPPVPAGGGTAECLVRFGESMPAGNFPVYRLWMTQATQTEWTSRHKLNNTPLSVTFVLGNSRVIYGAKALYAGSPYIAPGYISPVSGRCGYTISFPADDPFLGGTDLILDWPGGHGGERTGLQEQMAYWLAEQMELPYSHRYTIRLFVNGVSDMQRDSVFEAVNQPSGDFLKAWAPDDANGDFYKIDRAFEFTDSGGLAADPQPRLQNYTTTGGAKKTARYRWNWLKRAAGEPNDYANIFELVDAVNEPSPEAYTYLTENLVEIEEWMGLFAFEHIIANFDAYGHEIGKNMYAYKPTEGRWQLYAFDLDWLMLAAQRRRSSYDPSAAPLYNSEDPTISRMYNHPPFRRAYLQAVKRAVEGPMQSAICDPVMDAKYESLVANGITKCDGQTLVNPAEVKDWFVKRRVFLLSQLAEASAPLAIATNNGRDLQTTNMFLTLQGTAPLEVKTFQVNGAALAVQWDSVTVWHAVISLAAGPNILRVTGLDAKGTAVASTQITITLLGPRTRPAVSVEARGNNLDLSWATVAGFSYAVESTEDLSIAGWKQERVVTASGDSMSVRLALEAGTRRFFRIQVLPPGG